MKWWKTTLPSGRASTEKHQRVTRARRTAGLSVWRLRHRPPWWRKCIASAARRARIITATVNLPHTRHFAGRAWRRHDPKSAEALPEFKYAPVNRPKAHIRWRAATRLAVAAPNGPFVQIFQSAGAAGTYCGPRRSRVEVARPFHRNDGGTNVSPLFVSCNANMRALL